MLQSASIAAFNTKTHQQSAKKAAKSTEKPELILTQLTSEQNLRLSLSDAIPAG